MKTKIQFELKDQFELEMLICGLRLSAKDARDYHSACTSQNKEDRDELKYWDRRATLLYRLMKEAELTRSIN